MEKSRCEIKRWQTFSIESNREKRHIVIKLILKPFIKKYFEKKKLIKDYYFELTNDDRAEIKLAFLTEGNELSSTLFSNYFTKAIKEPSFKSATQDYVFSIADNDFVFPTLYIPSILVECGIYNKISSVMIQRLADAPITESKLLNFSLYLQLCWLKEKNFGSLQDVQSIIIQGYIVRNASEKFLNHVNLIQGTHSKLIADIAICIFSNENSTSRPRWLSKWSKECRDMVIRNNKEFENSPFLTDLTSYYFPALLNQQLGISDKLRSVQMAFINKILLEIQNSKLN